MALALRSAWPALRALLCRCRPFGWRRLFAQGPLRCSGACRPGGAAFPLCCAVRRPPLPLCGAGHIPWRLCGPPGRLRAPRRRCRPWCRQATASYLPGSVNATVHVTQMDGKPARLNAYLEAVPGLAQGDIFTAQLEFSTPENTSYARARRADGVYLDAAAQQVAVVGRQGRLAGAARQLRRNCAAR